MADELSACSEGVVGKTLYQIAALSVHENKFVNKLSGNGDVKIATLFSLRYGRPPMAHESNRHQQQFISATISGANRKIADRGLKIVPGQRRRTYRMVRI
jgi:hypothetical protein